MRALALFTILAGILPAQLWVFPSGDTTPPPLSWPGAIPGSTTETIDALTMWHSEADVAYGGTLPPRLAFTATWSASWAQPAGIPYPTTFDLIRIVLLDVAAGEPETLTPWGLWRGGLEPIVEIHLTPSDWWVQLSYAAAATGWIGPCEWYEIPDAWVQPLFIGEAGGWPLVGWLSEPINLGEL